MSVNELNSTHVDGLVLSTLISQLNEAKRGEVKCRLCLITVVV